MENIKKFIDFFKNLKEDADKKTILSIVNPTKQIAIGIILSGIFLTLYWTFFYNSNIYRSVTHPEIKIDAVSVWLKSFCLYFFIFHTLHGVCASINLPLDFRNFKKNFLKWMHEVKFLKIEVFISICASIIASDVFSQLFDPENLPEFSNEESFRNYLLLPLENINLIRRYSGVCFFATIFCFMHRIIKFRYFRENSVLSKKPMAQKNFFTTLTTITYPIFIGFFSSQIGIALTLEFDPPHDTSTYTDLTGINMWNSIENFNIYIGSLINSWILLIDLH